MNTMTNSESYSNKDDVASVTWSDPLSAMGDYPYYPYLSVPQSTYPGLVSVPGYPSIAGTYVSDFNATNDAAFSLAPTTEMGAFANLPIQVDFTNPNVLDPWSMPGPSFFDANSVGNPYGTGVASLAAYSVAATPDSGVSPTSTAPISQDEWAWLPDYLESTRTTPASSPGHGGEAGWVAPEQGANLSEVVTSPAGWDASGISWPIPVALGDVTTFAPAAALGKRRGEAEKPLGDGGPAGTQADEIPPPKRARGGGTAKGILKAARSAARTRRKPAARTPKATINDKPKEARRGAERLATPSSHGIYHQSMLGPSFQQGWAVDAANGKPIWVEGSVDEEAVHHIDSTQEQHEEATELIIIPPIEPAYILFLQASKDDLERGAVQAIKCRLCSDTGFKDFEDFKRHCRYKEKHPLEIRFCDRCGDFFARQDSLKRHNNLPPRECRKVTPVKAAEKRRVTEGEHEAFIRRLVHGLMSGEDIGRPFCQIIKEKYPESSKKRTGSSW